MVTPAWFYSTIAQASAAIIGLTIAFTVSTHLSRRERRRRRTDKAREEAIELKQRYQPLMDTIARTIKENADINVDNTRYELEDVSSVESWASNKNAPISAQIWALTSGISQTLSDFTVLSAEPTREQLAKLQNAVQELEYTLLYRDNGNDKTLYTEITGQPPEEAEGFYYHDDILEDTERISAWLDRNRRTRDENIAGARPSDLTGKNIFSLTTIMEILDSDLDNFGVNAVESDLTADFLQRNFGSHVLSTSTRLAVFGIFLPILFLISPPDLSLPMWIVEVIPSTVFDVIDGAQTLLNLLAQITILSASAFYTVRLFTIMRLDMNTTVPTMGELLGVEDENESEAESDSTPDNPQFTGLLRYVVQWVQVKSLPKNLQDEVRETGS
jgi:hypothetical protein